MAQLTKIEEEELRQDFEIYRRVMAEVAKFRNQLEAEQREPIMNALLGALVRIQADHLVTIKDLHVRKEMIKAVKDGLSTAVRNSSAQGQASVLSLGKPPH